MIIDTMLSGSELLSLGGNEQEQSRSRAGQVKNKDTGGREITLNQ